MGSNRVLLITGVSGFLGSRISFLAHEQGYEVHGLVRKTSSLSGIMDHSWLRLHTADLSDRRELSEILTHTDYVIHTAGVMATTARNRKDSHRTNLELTRIIAEESAEAGIKRFVYCSSLAAGGPGKGQDARTEQDPDHPVSFYGRSKLHAEKMLASMSNDLSVIFLRFSTIYGPGDRNIFGFFKAASGRIIPVPGGRKILVNSMVYVDDAARASLAAMDADVPSGSVYQISDGKPYPLPRMFDYMEQALGKTQKAKRLSIPYWLVMLQSWWLHDVVRKRGISPDQVRQMRALYWFASPEKAIRELGWKPEVDFTEGLTRTVKWYRDHNWLSSPHKVTA
ncbi:NAD-dependent epimerase/dehydratase family protein [candidate division WOR-3 bacterium]|nr:NAD-dependent epimerase/dehydratase family protein [candidate division WOR-3 bacterium]